MQRAKMFYRLGHSALHAVFIRYICRNENRVVAGLQSGGGAQFGIYFRHHYLGAFPRENSSRRPRDARPGPGNHRDLAIQSTHIRFLPAFLVSQLITL